VTRTRGPARPTRLALLAALVVVVAACGADPAPTATGEDETAATDDGREEVAAPDDEGAPDPEGVPESADPTDPPAREETAPAPDPDDAPEPADEPEDAVVVPALLDFTAPGVGGGQVVGAEHAGEAVALWFWAPW
jgi:hypothetical protein